MPEKLPEVQTNLLSYNAAVSATEKSGRWQCATDLLAIGAWSGLQTDVISFNAAISACNAGDAWKGALEVLAELQTRSLDADIISFNSAISACEKSQRWQQALSLLSEALQSSPLFPDSTPLAKALVPQVFGLSNQFQVVSNGCASSSRFEMHSCNLQCLHQCMRLWCGLALVLVALWADDVARTLTLVNSACLESGGK